jgi:hypothetical protein
MDAIDPRDQRAIGLNAAEVRRRNPFLGPRRLQRVGQYPLRALEALDRSARRRTLGPLQRRKQAHNQRHQQHQMVEGRGVNHGAEYDGAHKPVG